MTRLEPDRPVPASHVAAMDPRVKLLATLATVVAVSTLPAGSGWRFPVALALLVALLPAARLPAGYLGRRFLAVAPFVMMAAVLPWAAGAPDSWALGSAVVWKALCAVTVLSLLAGTTPIGKIVEALHQLGAPRGLVLVTVLAHRYVFVLLDEWRRMARARECRAGGRIATGRIRVLASHASMVFVRGWERSQRVAQALLARGFRGEFRHPRAARPATRDILLGALPPLAMALLRVA